MSALARIALLEDRLNPVLVKEVRQALRSRQFRSAFGFTLVVSLIVAVSIVLGNTERAAWEPIGTMFFTGIFGCLAVAVIGFVPMAAFNAMGAEFDENTYDMLVLSHMRPRHIMLGKLFSAGVQALLYFSVFGFYTVFAFLLGGVDLALVLVSLPLLAIVSLALSSVALGLSSLSRKRVVRVGLMVVLSAGLVFSVIGAISMQVAASELGIDFTAPEVQAGLSAVLVACLVVGSLFFVIGTSRLAHEEENRSTGLRVLGFLMILISLGWAAWVHDQLGQIEPLVFVSCVAVAAATILGTFFATERETLGRRVSVSLPNNKLLRLFLLPWLPGGGRGALWLLGMNASIVAFVLWRLSASSLTGFLVVSGSELRDLIVVVAAYSLIYVLLPSALLSNRGKTPKQTIRARITIPALFILGMLVPAILGFMLDWQDLAMGQHFGNPFWAGVQVVKGSFDYSPVLVAAGFVVLLQALRLARCAREVWTAPTYGSA